MMPHRAASPAASENDLDITHLISKNAGDSDDSTAETRSTNVAPRSRAKPATFVDDGGVRDLVSDGSEDDDETFIALQQSASNRKASNLKGRSVKKGGGFQAMGLNSSLLKAIARKGFAVPTPIQRKTIPLVLDGQDVVGMARTGSGKTAAFVVPMIEKLKVHSAKVGARGLILSPSRELALQTLKVVKEFGRGTDLKCVLLVGGDSLEDQFGYMTGNPDIIIATPGRFLHLQVEMSLDLSSIRYVVFDEADRLFEMGFAAQLTEILHALPTSRQTLLFSATLPKSLVEFARAGLQEPNLVRLDAESKVSPDLQSAFFTVKSSEKEGALLYLLNDVIKMPTGPPSAATTADDMGDDAKKGKKRKRGAHNPKANESPTAHSTIIFTATKHHVEYLAQLLRFYGFAVSHAYGSLDQTARRMQVEAFRRGQSNLLVVTDVAARGIDIPVLANVINYDFPAQPKIFVHRVGRTARAGQRGWSYSLVREADAPYLLDLQLFLGKPLVLGRDDPEKKPSFVQDVVVGGLPLQGLEQGCEAANKLLDDDAEMAALRNVAGKGEKLYIRTRNSSSAESAKRAKPLVSSTGWSALNPLFRDDVNAKESEREDMLARISQFRPQETVFEIGRKGNASEAAEIMRRQRAAIERRREKEEKVIDAASQDSDTEMVIGEDTDGGGDENLDGFAPDDLSDDVEITVSQGEGNQKGTIKELWKDDENFMSYTPSTINIAEDRGYGVHSGSYNTAAQNSNSNFVAAARGVTMDLGNDEGAKTFAEPSRIQGKRWDKKGKKYVDRANDEDGSKGAKMIRGESGQKIAASFRSGRFDSWRKSNKVDRMPRTGEAESNTRSTMTKSYRHKQERAPKEADKFRDDYHSRKKRIAEAKEKRVGRFKEGSGKRELKSVDDVRKERKIKEKKKEKNARPTKKRRA